MKKRLLLVEEDPDILDALGLLLSDRYEVTLARDGARALACVEAQRFDVLVLGLLLSVREGSRLRETLRQQGLPTPVILTSAHRDLAAQEAQHQQLGAFASLRKPFAIRELEKWIERALGGGGPGAGRAVA